MEETDEKNNFSQNNSIVSNSNLNCENTALQKTKDYFSSHNYLHKNDLQFFIKFIGLDTVWTTEDDYITFWSCLLQYKSEDNNNQDQLSENETIKGVSNITTVSNSHTSSLLFNSISNYKNDLSVYKEGNTLSHHQTMLYNNESSFSEIMNEFSYQKILHIKYVLMLLRLKNNVNKTTIHYKDILAIVNKYSSILKCSFNDVEKVVISLEDHHSITSSEYEINLQKYEMLMQKIDEILNKNKYVNNDETVNFVLDILKLHLINNPDNSDINDCFHMLNNNYFRHSVDMNNVQQNSIISNKVNDTKHLLLNNDHSNKEINDNIFINESPMDVVSKENLNNTNNSMNKNTSNIDKEKESLKEVTTMIKLDDVSNSRCDFFSIHEKENEKMLFDNTNIMDTSSRLPNNMSEIYNDSSKLKPHIDFSSSFDKEKLSFLSISNIHDKKKHDEIKEESSDDDAKFGMTLTTSPIDVHRKTNTHNITSNNCPNSHLNTNSSNNVSNTNNLNNNIGVIGNSGNYGTNPRISLNNISNNNMSNMKSKTSRTINSRVNDSRSTMSLSKLRNEDFSNILLSEAGQNTCYDFLSLKDNSTIMKMLEKNNEIGNTYEFYSNTVFFFEQNEKKKYIILITSIYIYLLDSITYNLTKRIQLKHLKKLTISNKNCNLLVFHFDDEINNDLILEILRRFELLVYFRDLYKFKGYLKLQIKIANKFKVKKNSQYITMHVSNSSSKKFLITPNFENAIKIGYLYQYKTGLFGSSLKEKLLVLTGVGLLIFDQPNETPKAIIAIIGNEIKKVDYKTYGMYAFQIKTSSGEHMIFGTQNEVEFNSWYEGFKCLKNAYNNKIRSVEPVSNKKKGGWDY